MSHLNFLFLTNQHLVWGVGRHRDVMQYSDQRLEEQHDFIQWMFPDVLPSQFCPEIPTLNRFSVPAIKQHPDAIVSLYAGLELMSGFYQRTTQWTEEGDHNQFRITRILRSTAILVGNDVAKSWFSALPNPPANRYWAPWAR